MIKKWVKKDMMRGMYFVHTFEFADIVFLRCLSDGCILHCQYSAFKNNKYENRLGHVIYWWKGDNLCCFWLVFEVRRLDMISDSCLMGGNDGIYIEMYLKSYLIGSLAVVNVYLTCIFWGYLYYKPMFHWNAKSQF